MQIFGQVYCTDGYGAYLRHLPEEKHEIGKNKTFCDRTVISGAGGDLPKAALRGLALSRGAARSHPDLLRRYVVKMLENRRLTYLASIYDSSPEPVEVI